MHFCQRGERNDSDAQHHLHVNELLVRALLRGCFSQILRRVLENLPRRRGDMAALIVSFYGIRIENCAYLPLNRPTNTTQISRPAAVHAAVMESGLVAVFFHQRASVELPVASIAFCASQPDRGDYAVAARQNLGLTGPVQ